MPKGNGDAKDFKRSAAMLNGQEHGECRKAMETKQPYLLFGRIPSQEHGECRKAIETGHFGPVVSFFSLVRNTVNAERQWRRPHVRRERVVLLRQEHGECRKAMETRSARRPSFRLTPSGTR